MKRILLSCAALAALAAPSFAQSSYGGAQVQLNDVASHLDIEVDEADEVGGTAVAGGNSLTVESAGHDFRVDGSQDSDGDVRARADAQVWDAWGAVVINSTATNNGITAVAEDGDVRVAAAQRSSGDANATTNVQTGNVGASAASASAGNNVVAADAVNGDMTLLLSQDSDGSANALVEADHCCVSTQAVAASVASANNINASGSTTTMLTSSTQRSTGAAVTARTDLYSGYTGDAVGNATANGNALTLSNEWGYMNAASSQANASRVTAEGYVTLGGDWLGFASASAYGVGNAVTASNVGSDTVLATDQTNTGDVQAFAALAGEGGDGLGSSAAYGNVVSGGLCTTCANSETTLSASNYQSNSGAVDAVTRVRMNRGNSVAASATAVGNAATYVAAGQ